MNRILNCTNKTKSEKCAHNRHEQDILFVLLSILFESLLCALFSDLVLFVQLSILFMSVMCTLF